jgi:hypothetical protein
MNQIVTNSSKKLSVKLQIENLQNELLKMPPSDIVTEHAFYPGFYERKITIPAWTVLTGAEHKTGYTVRLEKGTIAVNVEDTIKFLTAPLQFESKPGAQRVGRVYEEEVVWVDVYENPDNCQNLEILEERLFVVPECGLQDNRIKKQIKEAHDNYNLFCKELGLKQEEIDTIVSIKHDLMEMPKEYFTEKRPSKIHGQGLFATKSFKMWDVVCPCRLNEKRTPGGRFINHSQKNNLMPIKIGDDIYAIASQDIYQNEELLLDYRSMVRVNFGINLQGELICQPEYQVQ